MIKYNSFLLLTSWGSSLADYIHDGDVCVFDGENDGLISDNISSLIEAYETKLVGSELPVTPFSRLIYKIRCSLFSFRIKSR